jgi:hypothetical protein
MIRCTSLGGGLDSIFPPITFFTLRTIFRKVTWIPLLSSAYLKKPEKLILLGGRVQRSDKKIRTKIFGQEHSDKVRVSEKFEAAA